MAQWMELFNYTILEHRYIEIRQQTGCPCGSQFLYEVDRDGQACSFDHALGLRKRAEPAEGGESQYERVAGGKTGESLMDAQDAVCDFQ